MCDLGITYTRGLIRFSNCAGPTRLSLSHPHEECLDPNLPTESMAKTDQSLCYLLEYSMTAKLLTEHHLEFLGLKLGCRGSSESTLVKMSHCWKSHVAFVLFV